MTDARRTVLAAAFGANELDIEPLSGGLLGRCFRVMSSTVDAAVRLPGQHDARQSAAAEIRILEAAAAAGIAPRPLHVPTELGIVATEYLARARPWSMADARTPENIRRLARLLATLHALDIQLEPLEFSIVAAQYAARAAERSTLSSEQTRWRDELLELARAFDAWQRPCVPCHNDLVASNVLDDGNLWLVDFEFAVHGDPILDLASVAAFNDFAYDARAELLAAYYGAAGPPFDAEHFLRTIRLVRLLAYFWSAAETPPDESVNAIRAFADGLAAVLR